MNSVWSKPWFPSDGSPAPWVRRGILQMSGDPGVKAGAKVPWGAVAFFAFLFLTCVVSCACRVPARISKWYRSRRAARAAARSARASQRRQARPSLEERRQAERPTSIDIPPPGPNEEGHGRPNTSVKKSPASSAFVSAKAAEEGMECAVCVEGFQKGESVRLLRKCNHIFHADCIAVWLQSSSTCPLCRCSVAPQSDSELSVLVEPTPLPREGPQTQTRQWKYVQPWSVRIHARS